MKLKQEIVRKILDRVTNKRTYNVSLKMVSGVVLQKWLPSHECIITT